MAIASDCRGGLEYASAVALADTFQEIVDSLPSDWTDLQLDLRIDDETRYVEAAVIVAQCNAQPYSQARLALAPAGRAPLRPRRRGPDRARRAARSSTPPGITGELALREVREGRVEVVPMWGRPQSVRRGIRQPARAVALAVRCKRGPARAVADGLPAARIDSPRSRPDGNHRRYQVEVSS